MLCFNDTHSAAPPFPYYVNTGAQIDNISLIVVSQDIMFSFAL